MIRDIPTNSSNIAFEIPLALIKMMVAISPCITKGTQLRNMPITNLKTSARVLQWIIMASLAYVCVVLARDSSANSSKIAFEVPLASNDGGNLVLIHKDYQLRNMLFSNVKKVQECNNG